MLEIIKQLALDVAENGADICMGIVVQEKPLRIRLEEGLELDERFLILTENVTESEESGKIRTWNTEEGDSWLYYRMVRDRKLKAEDSVALLRAADGQQYLVLERVKKGGIL